MRNDARNGASEARLFTIYDLEIMRAEGTGMRSDSEAEF